MVFLTLGTGIGCGIIAGDAVIIGDNDHGAECGHITIDCSENAPLCGCGQRGHLEAFASATAVVRRTREALDAGRPSSLSQRIAEGCKLSPKLLAEEAEAGDALSIEIIAETARYLSHGIVNLMHTIDPGVVLLGGAMTFGGNETTQGVRFLGRIKQEVAHRTFPMLAERTVIDFATLGSDAGYLGAAGMARLECNKRLR
jgi:glucokinase